MSLSIWLVYLFVYIPCTCICLQPFEMSIIWSSTVKCNGTVNRIISDDRINCNFLPPSYSLNLGQIPFIFLYSISLIRIYSTHVHFLFWSFLAPCTCICLQPFEMSIIWSSTVKCSWAWHTSDKTLNVFFHVSHVYKNGEVDSKFQHRMDNRSEVPEIAY
jgi:hypothetical protein